MNKIQKILMNKKFTVRYARMYENYVFRFHIVVQWVEKYTICVKLLSFSSLSMRSRWERIVDPYLSASVKSVMRVSILEHLEQYFGEQMKQYEIEFKIPPNIGTEVTIYFL